jgi:hypothetical protein
VKAPPGGPGLAWLLAIALLAAVYFAALARNPAPADVAVSDPSSERFESERLAAARAPKAFFLGTSLTACAVPFDDEWPALPERFASDFHVLRFTRSNGEQEDFPALLRKIRASDARLVLVEAEMMLRQRIPQPKVSFLHQLALDFRRPIRQSLSGLLPVSGRAALAGPPAAPSPGCPYGESNAEEFARQIASQRLLRDRPWMPEWLAFIREMKRSGRKVVLVSLGRSAVVQRSIDPRFVQRFKDMLDSSAREQQLELWIYDARLLPDSHFSDGVHLSRLGRADFSRWLAQRLAAEDAGK